MQKPKIQRYKKAMVSNIASALKITQKIVNIKATTTEFLGFEGRGEGISAYAIAMLKEANNGGLW